MAESADDVAIAACGAPPEKSAPPASPPPGAAAAATESIVFVALVHVGDGASAPAGSAPAAASTERPYKLSFVMRHIPITVEGITNAVGASSRA